VIEVKALALWRARSSPRPDGENILLRDGAYYAIMRSARILDDLERIGVPGVLQAYAHPARRTGWACVVSMRSNTPGSGAGAGAHAACPAAATTHSGSSRWTRTSIRTDFNDVLWALSTRCHPAEDIDTLRRPGRQG